MCARALVTNAVGPWNTIYMQAALDHLRNEGETLNEEDEVRLSPLRHVHVNMLGHYTFTLAEQVTKGQLRPLKRRKKQMNGFSDGLLTWRQKTSSFKK